MKDVPSAPPRDSDPNVRFDRSRAARIGIEEAVLAEPKSVAQIAAIVGDAMAEGRRLLLTRLTEAQREALPASQRAALDWDRLSRTAVLGGPAQPAKNAPRIAVVCAGTSDAPVAAEARRTLEYSGLSPDWIADVGVAGIWRLMERAEDLRAAQIVIAVAGMDAALPTVLGGLVPGLVIAVPTSVGYGVAAGGHAALHAILSSCAPGIVTVNIDNGYGAACAAMRAAGALHRAG